MTWRHASWNSGLVYARCPVHNALVVKREHGPLIARCQSCATESAQAIRSLQAREGTGSR